MTITIAHHDSPYAHRILNYDFLCADLAGGLGENLAEGVRPAGLEMQPLDSVMVFFFFVAVIVLLPIMINNFLVTIMVVMWDTTKVRLVEPALIYSIDDEIASSCPAQIFP